MARGQDDGLLLRVLPLGRRHLHVDVASLGHPRRGGPGEAVDDALGEGDVPPLPRRGHLPHDGPVDPLPLEALAQAELQGHRDGPCPVPLRRLLHDLERRALPPQAPEAPLLLLQSRFEVLPVEPGELRVEPEIEDLAARGEAGEEREAVEVDVERLEAREGRLDDVERHLDGTLRVGLADRDRHLRRRQAGPGVRLRDLCGDGDDGVGREGPPRLQVDPVAEDALAELLDAPQLDLAHPDGRGLGGRAAREEEEGEGRGGGPDASRGHAGSGSRPKASRPGSAGGARGCGS